VTKRCIAVFFLLSMFGFVMINSMQSGAVKAAQSGTDIYNYSVETVSPSDPDQPDNWSNNSWGNNKATFTYLNEGHTGDRSVKVEIEDYIFGDAKWFFHPIDLAPGDYMFSDYYRSNADSKVILAVTTDMGTTEYIDLPMAPASSAWTKYAASFTMPENGKSMTVYHVMARNGHLITDDYRIDPYEYEGFDRGRVTITFDDGWEGNLDTALPIMQKYGFKSNQFYATTYIQNPSVPDPRSLIQRFIDTGHEIGSHSVTHPDLTALTTQEVIDELVDSKTFLENYLNLTVKYFATPYGAYNAFVKDSIMKYYQAHRTAVDFGFNSKDNLDASKLKCMSILSTTTPQEVQEWVTKAKNEKLWLILLYHRIGDNPGEYGTTQELFDAQMKVIKDANIKVVTISEALAQIEGADPTPATPTLTAESAGYNSVKLGWTPASGATGYALYRATSSGGTYSKIKTLTGTTYTNTGLTTGKTYYYKVRAYCSDGSTTTYGSYSSVKSAKPVPATPTLTAKSSGYNSIKLTWTKVPGRTGYALYRAASKTGKYTKIKTLTGTSYTNTGLTTGKNYYYKVRAYCVAGSATTFGSYSSVKSAKPVPATPTLTAKSSGYNSIKLTWTKVPGRTGYALYRATSSGGTYTKIKTLTGTTYTNTGLTTGKTYYYKVRAYCDDGSTTTFGSYSSVKSARPVPSKPASVKAARASLGSIKLTWGAVSGATRYQVYRATSKTGKYSLIATTSNRSYTNKGLKTGKYYYYKVRAYRSVGSAKVYGGFSSVVYAKP